MKQLEGFYSSYIDAESEAKRLTDDLQCDAVLLSVWNTVDDGNDTPIMPSARGLYEDTQEECYWGFNNVCVHQIFPSQTTQFLIPVTNANQIFLRANKSKQGTTRRVAFSCFRYVERKQRLDD